MTNPFFIINIKSTCNYALLGYDTETAEIETIGLLNELTVSFKACYTPKTKAKCI
jgi:hypothetical protein